MCGENGKNNSAIGERLRKLRFENDLTQTEVAQEIGVTQQTYSKYESGDAKPDSETIIKLCGLYGVTADFLLGIEKPKVKQDSDKLSQISDGDVNVIVEKLLSKLKKGEEEV